MHQNISAIHMFVQNTQIPKIDIHCPIIGFKYFNTKIRQLLRSIPGCIQKFIV